MAEGIESFNLALSALSGATVLNPAGTAQIWENDQTAVAAPRISVDDVTVDESQTYAEFLVHLSAPGSAVVTVNYAGGEQHRAQRQRLRCAKRHAHLRPGRDSEDGAHGGAQRHRGRAQRENFFIALSAAVNATIARAGAIATIIDNDAPSGTPIVSINDFTVDEADKQASFLVTLDRPSTGVVSMNYATQNGTALAGSDYTAASGALHIRARRDRQDRQGRR